MVEGLVTVVVLLVLIALAGFAYLCVEVLKDPRYQTDRLFRSAAEQMKEVADERRRRSRQ